jgi:hypothetical protein
MAANAMTHPTLLDLSKRVTPGWDRQLSIINMLDKRHGLYAALPFLEANGAISHRASVVTGLPTSSVRLFNQGVASSTGTHTNIQFDLAIIKNWAEIDAELIKIAPDREMEVAQRLMEHYESARQKWSSLAWYGVGSDGMTGLSSLYNDPTALNGRNVIDAGGTDSSDNASMWLMNAGPGVSIRYPRGSAAGILREAGGYDTAENFGGTGLKARVWREEVGIAGAPVVEDWRDVVRVGSIDMSALQAGVNDANLIRLGRTAKAKLSGRPVYNRFWLMHSSVWEGVMHQRDDRQVAGGGVSTATIDGVEVDTFHGYEVRIDDNLLLTEAAV